jgi:hypothetical protein
MQDKIGNIKEKVKIINKKFENKNCERIKYKNLLK